MMTDKTVIRNRDSKHNPDRGGSGAHRTPHDQAAFEDSRAGRAEIAARLRRRPKQKIQKPSRNDAGKQAGRGIQRFNTDGGSRSIFQGKPRGASGK